MFPTFEFLGRTISIYGICAVVGLVLACLVATWLGKKQEYKFEDILLVILSVAVGLFIGAHILYGITQISGIKDLFLNMNDYTFITFNATLFGIYIGGMVFYGGFLGGLAGLAIHCHFSKYVTFKGMIDIYAVCIPLFHIFGRIGCFFAGCCYGIEWSWGFITYTNTINPSVNGVVRFPVQLFEAGCNVIIFLVLLFLYRKNRLENRLIFLYMIIYPVCRFILEFFRGDEIRGFIFGMSTSQFISILLFAAAIAGFIITGVKRKKAAA